MARKIGEAARTRSRKSSTVRTDPDSNKATTTPAASKSRGMSGAPANSLSNSAKSTSTPKRVSLKKTGVKSAEAKGKAASTVAVKNTTKEKSKTASRIAARILAGKLMPTLEQVRALAMSVLGQDEKSNQDRDKAKDKRKGKTKSKGKSKK